jgi:N-acetyl-gamma-glutamyl-phosphate reductase
MQGERQRFLALEEERKRQMMKAAIIGGSGYTGGELARLLCRHPGITLEAMTSRRLAGIKVADEHSNLEGFVDLKYEQTLNQKEEYDIVFVAAPHGASMEIVPSLLERGIKVIDLSGDYRLPDPNIYSKWYGLEHKDSKNLEISAYGIPELFREEIAKAALVANPGCYPTCACLGLAPLFANDTVEQRVVVDAKSGTSGAGMELTKMTHHPNCGSQIIPYKVGTHRHSPEIQMAMEKIAGSPIEVIFTPHLIPIVRGMLCTSYVQLKESMVNESLFKLYSDFYSGKRFVRMVSSPSISSVVGSNFCEIGLELVGMNTVVVMSALDNLVKGASGQAIQNANIMLGLPETAGLDFPGLGV